MVQGKHISILVVLSYLTAIIATILYLYYYTEFADWLGLVSALLLVGIFMLEGLGQVLTALKQPKLKILNPQVKTRNKNTRGEFKDVCFDVWNDSGQEAIETKIKIKVKELWQDFYLLPPRYNDLIPDGKMTFHLCQPIKSEEKVIIGDRKELPLDRGKIYELDMRFYGRNFRDRKTHRLKLDLSSWESIGIILDC